VLLLLSGWQGVEYRFCPLRHYSAYDQPHSRGEIGAIQSIDFTFGLDAIDPEGTGRSAGRKHFLRSGQQTEHLSKGSKETNGRELEIDDMSHKKESEESYAKENKAMQKKTEFDSWGGCLQRRRSHHHVSECHNPSAFSRSIFSCADSYQLTCSTKRLRAGFGARLCLPFENCAGCSTANEGMDGS
jgi:hypothetical protein